MKSLATGASHSDRLVDEKNRDSRGLNTNSTVSGTTVMSSIGSEVENKGIVGKDLDAGASSVSRGLQLRDMNLVIRPGQNAAIVGPSGSGKSTVLRLITRMMDPVSGQVREIVVGVVVVGGEVAVAVVFLFTSFLCNHE